MRTNGVLDSTAGLLPFGHVGWGYRTRDEFLTRAANYILDGVAQNHRIAYVGEGGRAALSAELADLPQLVDHCLSDHVEVLSASDYYAFRPGTDVLDPDASLALYLSAVEQATADGYSGFRAVVDVTSVARSPEQRATLAELEVRVDREMAVRPFSALCGYDVRQLGAASAELVCLHPYVRRGSVGFRLFAEPDDGIDFVLAGEIDVASDSAFTTTLQRVWPTLPRDTARVDAKALNFIGHRQLITLDRHARDYDFEVVLQTDRPIPARLADLLDLTNVRVEPPSTPSPCDKTATEQVKDAVMQSLGVDEEQALAVLVEYSRDTGTGPEDVAARVRDELSHTAPADGRQATLQTLQEIRDRLRR